MTLWAREFSFPRSVGQHRFGERSAGSPPVGLVGSPQGSLSTSTATIQVLLISLSRPCSGLPNEPPLNQRSDSSIEEAAARIARLFTDGRTDASALANPHAGLPRVDDRERTPTLAYRLANTRVELSPQDLAVQRWRPPSACPGSGNATGRGTGAGVEHLDVDVTWIDHSRDRVRLGIRMLDDWARGRSAGIVRVMDLPEALEQDIIRTAPSEAPDANAYVNAVRQDGSPAWAEDRRATLRSRFSPSVSAQIPRLAIPSALVWQDGLYKHQGEAVTAWEGGENPERGTISMATGAGKTLTALICATRVQERLGDVPFLIVVSAPSRPIIQQWRNEIHRFGIRAVTPSLEPSPDSALTGLFRGLTGGGTHVAVVSNSMLCDPAFQNTVLRKTCEGSTQIDTLFIADEAHSLGAPGFLAHKPTFFSRRLALSATPQRQYDPDGTEEILDFFGPAVYEFGLDRAIGFCLSPYNYYVHAATIADTELESFLALTQRHLAPRCHRQDSGDRRKSPPAPHCSSPYRRNG